MSGGQSRRAIMLGVLAAIFFLPDDVDAGRRRSPGRRSRGRRRGGGGGGGGNTSYANCREARAAGAAPLRRGQPGYSRRLDRDGDGVACE